MLVLIGKISTHYNHKSNKFLHSTNLIQETYGDCNYSALKNYIFSAYGCYPPWMMDERNNKICEIGLENKEIDINLFEEVWRVISKLTDGRTPNVLQHCLPPCYQIMCQLDMKLDDSYTRETAYLDIYDDAKTVPIYKAVHSFDVFMLSVELGSALGLWLGIAKYY